MYTTALLLLVLNSYPQRLDEILEEIENIALHRTAAPFGGSQPLLAAATSDQEIQEQLLRLITIRNTLEALDELAKEDFIRQEDGRYRITNTGIAAAAIIIRSFKRPALWK